MAQKHQSKLVVLLPLLLLAACTSGEKWPNLSDKLPDVAERNRVLESSDPAVSPRTPDASPLSEADALQLMQGISGAVSQSTEQFTAAMASWRESSGADRRSRWMGAQLAVTRLSQTVSRVNAILFNDELKNGNAQAQAQALKNRVEKTVADARQELSANAP